MNDNEAGYVCERCGHDIAQHRRTKSCAEPYCYCGEFLIAELSDPEPETGQPHS